MKNVYLGIDTSNYKTSVSAVGADGEVLFEKSVLLDVPKGSRGLRQSEAFWHHSNRLPGYIGEMLGTIRAAEVCAAGVSDRPRRQEGSYMPCFLAGVNAAEIIAQTLGVPVYAFSHQEGHAAAVMPDSIREDVIFMHLSGGTTEFLLCRPDERGYDMRIIGGTKDISFGQLLDRFGVALGYPFPAGRSLDELAAGADCGTLQSRRRGILPKIKIDDGFFNLSGAEAKLMAFAAGPEASDRDQTQQACAETFRYIADILSDSAACLSGRYGASAVYIAGGVASSSTIRSLVRQPEHGARIFFGDAALSGDNAVGAARLARRAYKGK